MTNFSSLPSRSSHGRRVHALGSHITTFVRYHLRKLNSKYKVQQSQQTHLDISHAHLCLTTANSTTLYTIQALIIYIYSTYTGSWILSRFPYIFNIHGVRYTSHPSPISYTLSNAHTYLPYTIRLPPATPDKHYYPFYSHLTLGIKNNK